MRVWVVLVGFGLRGGMVRLTVPENGVLGVIFYADDLADVVFFVLRQRRGEVFPICQQSWRPANGERLAGLVADGVPLTG